MTQPIAQATAQATGRHGTATVDRAIGATPGFIAYRLKLTGRDVLGLRLAPALFAEGASPVPLSARSSVERSRDLAARNRVELPADVEDGLGHGLEDFARLADPACGALAPILADVAPGERPGLWQVFDIDPRHLFQPVTAPLAAPDVARVAAALGAALAALHDRGCLHLDVCPDLVGREADGVRLCGMGLPLREWAGADKARNLFVRMETAPPELADLSRRSPLGPWTDIFQAAATLFWLATGAPPPDYRQRAALPGAGRAQIDEALAACGLAEALPELAGAVARGLALPRTERPQVVADWLDPAWLDPACCAPPAVAAPEPEEQPPEPEVEAKPEIEPEPETIVVAAPVRTVSPGTAQGEVVKPGRWRGIGLVLAALVAGAAAWTLYQPGGDAAPESAPAASPAPAPVRAPPPEPVPTLTATPIPTPEPPSPHAALAGSYSNDATSARAGSCDRPLQIIPPPAASTFALTVVRQNGDTWQLVSDGSGLFTVDQIRDPQGRIISPPGGKQRWAIARDGERLAFTYPGTEFKEEYWLCRTQ